MLNVYEQVDNNKRKSFLVMLFFTIFVAGFAYVLGKASGYGFSWGGFAFVFFRFMSHVFFYFFSQKNFTQFYFYIALVSDF